MSYSALGTEALAPSQAEQICLDAGGTPEQCAALTGNGNGNGTAIPKPSGKEVGPVLTTGVVLVDKEYGGIRYQQFSEPTAVVSFLSYYEVSQATSAIPVLPEGSVVLIDPFGAAEIKGQATFLDWMNVVMSPPPEGMGVAIGLLITPDDSYIFVANTVEQLAAMQEAYGYGNVIVILEPHQGWDAQGAKGIPVAEDKTKTYLAVGAALVGGIALAFLMKKG
jgi:hypothetical protein